MKDSMTPLLFVTDPKNMPFKNIQKIILEKNIKKAWQKTTKYFDKFVRGNL